MKPRALIVMGCVFVVLLAYLAIRPGGWFRGGKKTDPLADTPVFGPALGDPSGIEIAPQGGQTVRLAKTAGVWRIAAPLDARADGEAVAALVGKLKELRYQRSVVTEGESVEDDAVTGLGKPAWTVRIHWSSGRQSELCVGLSLLGEPASYVRVGKAAGVVPANFASLVGKTANEFRDRKILRLEEAKIARMTLAAGKQTVELARGKDAKWAILSPASAAADQGAADRIAHALSDLTAADFVPGRVTDPERYGLAGQRLTARAVIEMQPASPATGASQPATKPAGAVYTLLVGEKNQNNVYVKLSDSDEVYLVAADLAETLRPDLQALRRKKLVDVTPAEVDALSIGTARLEKTNAEWNFRAPTAGRADYDGVESFLQALCDLEAEKFADSGSPAGLYGLDSPAAVIKLRLAGKDKTVTVLVGSRTDATGDKRFVKLADAKAVAVLSADKVKPLLAEPWTLTDRQLWRTPAVKLTTLRVVRDGTAVELAVRDGGTWAMVKPIAAPVDRERIAKLLDRLRLLQADAIVAYPKPTDAMLKAPDHVTLAMTMEKRVPLATKPAATRPATTQPGTAPAPVPAFTTETTVVTFHAVKVDGKVRAWVDGQAVTPVGEFPEAFWDDVTAELRDRTLAAVPADQVKTLRITRDQEVTELLRTDTGWRYTAGKYVDMDADKIREFLQDAGSLKAERFASHSDADADKFGLSAAKRKIELIDGKGAVTTIRLSDRGPDAARRYAAVSGAAGIAVIAGPDAAKLDKSWKDFKKSDKPDKPE